LIDAIVEEELEAALGAAESKLRNLEAKAPVRLREELAEEYRG
jgi:hypothetical protein